MKTIISETENSTNKFWPTGDNSNNSKYLNIQLLRSSEAMDAFETFPFQYDESCPLSLRRKSEMMITTLMESFANTRLEVLELFTEEEFKFFVCMFHDDFDTLFLGLNWFLTEIKNVCKYSEIDKLLSLDMEHLIEKVSKLSYFQALCLRLLAISYRNEPNLETRFTFNPNNLEDMNKFNQIFGYSENFKRFVKYYFEVEF